MNRATTIPSAGKLVLDAAGIDQKVQSLSQSILKEFGKDISKLVIVGIPDAGSAACSTDCKITLRGNRQRDSRWYSSTLPPLPRRRA